MLDFDTKVDGAAPPAGILPAAQFNNYIDELENAVTKTGQTLDGTGVDITQLSQAMTINASGSDFYTSTGTDNYTLSTLVSGVSFVAPLTYFNGMRVRTVINNPNTGPSTVNVASLGSKDIFNSGFALTGGELTDNVELVFDSVNDRFNLIRSGNNGEPPLFQTGVFTPTLTAAIGSGTSTNTGTFSLVGNLVYINIRILLVTVETMSGALTVGGLPFSLDTGNNDIGVYCNFANDLVDLVGEPVTGYESSPGSSSFDLFSWSATSGMGVFTAIKLSDGGVLRMSGFYSKS